MTTRIDLVGISGSLRRSSLNTALLRAARELLSAGVSLEILDLNGIPMYNWDEEQEHGFPDSVALFRERVAAADGIVFASPEYNWSVTAALKNALDWLSRGPDSPLDFMPAAIMGAGGGSGTAAAQRHLRDILSHNRFCVVADPQVMVARAPTHFEGLKLVDPGVRADIRIMLERLVAIVQRARSLPPQRIPGSVLVVGRDGAAVGDVSRRIAEMGHRTLEGLTDIDTIRLLETRAVAAVVIGANVEESSRESVFERSPALHPEAPIVLTADPAAAASEVDDALRYRVATG
jgi:chromate reductase